jgi:hypothetical protein
MGRKNLSATSRKAAVNARKSPANKTPKGSGKKKSAKKKKSSSEEEEEEEEEEEDEADEEEGKKTSKIQYVQRPGKEGSPKGIKNNRLTKESFRKHYRASAGGRKKKVYWTMMEVDALERGFKKYGRKWSRILEVFRVEFNTCRTSVDLKDKYDGMQRSKSKNVDDDAASPKKKRQKLSHSIQADNESDEEDEAMEEEEEDEDEEDIFDGDVRVRVRFGRKGKVHKLAAVGNHTFEELIEGCREVNGVTTHQENIYVQASMMKDDEADVDAEACVGTVVPSDFDASSGKPKVWMVVRSKQGDSPKKKSTSSKKKVAAQNGESL